MWNARHGSGKRVNDYTLARPAAVEWLDAILDPRLAATWSLDDWRRVVPMARRLRLLARLAEGLDAAGFMQGVPSGPRRNLVSEQRVARYRTTAMTWAIERVGAALGEQHHPKVLLKGAAYVAQALPIAAGRMPSDVDILVPQTQLEAAQAKLMGVGWQARPLDDHDQRYYREWSHEVPPMRHPLHPIELDLHHNIVPPVARTTVDADLLLGRLRPSPLPGWMVLHPVDQVLHSAAHLFLDSEARDRVRDLVDLDGLLRHFGGEPSFWDDLPRRAEELGLTEPLALACRFCIDWLGTPVPHQASRRILSGATGQWYRWALVPTLRAILTPADPASNPPLRQRAAAMLFLARYHLNRLPVHLLVPHLWHKLHRSRTAVMTATPRG